MILLLSVKEVRESRNESLIINKNFYFKDADIFPLFNTRHMSLTRKDIFRNFLFWNIFDRLKLDFYKSCSKS